MRSEINKDLRKTKVELGEIRGCMPRDDKRDGEELKKLEKEVNEIKTVMEGKVKRTVMVVKKDVEEALEIERRKMNLVFHGVPETDAEQGIVQVAEILGMGLHMDFERHVLGMFRIGTWEENKIRPLRIVVKSLDGQKEILSRAKDLKNVEKLNRMFISPDLTRR
jgi:hypothetical protein